MHFLKHIFNEKDFTNEELNSIIPAFKKSTFKKHDYLLKEGFTENLYWFVESGYIRSFAIDPAGNDISTHFYSKGDIVIDWVSFFHRKPTRENIQALTDCICWQLDFDTFQQFFHTIEAFRETGRTRLVGSYFELKVNSISMIVDQAKDRYKRLMKKKPDLLHNIPLKQLATYLGITDTSLSRIRKEIIEELN